MKQQPKPKIRIVQDTREQMPFLFWPYQHEVEVVVRGLKQGEKGQK